MENCNKYHHRLVLSAGWLLDSPVPWLLSYLEGLKDAAWICNFCFCSEPLFYLLEWSSWFNSSLISPQRCSKDLWPGIWGHSFPFEIFSFWIKDVGEWRIPSVYLFFHTNVYLLNFLHEGNSRLLGVCLNSCLSLFRSLLRNTFLIKNFF